MDVVNKGKEIINTIKGKITKNKEDKRKNEIKVNNPSEFNISKTQENILLKLSKSRKTQECIKKRAEIIILFNEKRNKSVVANELGCYWNKVHTWVNKISANSEILKKTELEEPHKLKRLLISILSDKYRSGRKSTFSSTQIACIIYTSLQEPEKLGVPISHWSAKSLTEQVIKMKIVEKISVRQVSRYLNEMDINVYRYKGWLNSIEKNEDFEAFKKKN